MSNTSNTEDVLGTLKDRLLGLHKPGIIYVHIPKTGGSSISASLRKHYRLSKFNIKSEVTSLAAQKRFGIVQSDPGYEEALHQFRQSLIFHEAQKGTRYITDHFWVDTNLLYLKPLGYRIITCLRNPVDRWFSQYFYGRYKDGSHGRIDQDIEEFLQTSRAASYGTIYVRYLGGIRDDRDYTSRTAIQRAIDHLDMFDMVGFLDRLAEFHAWIKEDTGIILRSEHRRRSPATAAFRQKIKSSREFQNAVEKLCEPDAEVYEQAMRKFT